MAKILLATTNPGKLREMTRAFEGSPFEIVSLRDFPNIKSVEETGETFEENAILKAKGYFAQTGIPCIADDGGLIVDHLGGAPGAQSRRWLGENISDEELAKAITERLEGVPCEKRTAKLGGFLVFWNGKVLLTYENYIEGFITNKPVGVIEKGFPYRAILYIPMFKKLYADLTDEEHHQVNFRRKSLEILKRDLLDIHDYRDDISFVY